MKTKESYTQFLESAEGRMYWLYDRSLRAGENLNAFGPQSGLKDVD